MKLTLPRLFRHSASMPWACMALLFMADGLAAQPESAKRSCVSFNQQQIKASQIGLPTRGATIISAELKPAYDGGGNPADALPEYCNLIGEIHSVDPAAPPIRFGIALPTRWSQKALHIGGGGTDGYIPLLARLNRRAGSPYGPLFPLDAPFPLTQGYVTYGSDSGHGGATPPGEARETGPRIDVDTSWQKNEESYFNFAHAHVKKMHDVAMVIVKDMYGTRPRLNYFGGQSQGGRSALMAVARYAADYDGVIAAVPLTSFTSLQIRNTLRIKSQLQPGAWLPPQKAAAVHGETLRQCDALDGLQDGVINNYFQCNRLFDPTITPAPLKQLRCEGGADTGFDCLSDAQIAMLDAYHATLQPPFALATGLPLMGMPAGAERTQWLLLMPQPNANDPGSVPGVHAHLINRVAPVVELLTQDIAQFKTPIQNLSALLDVPTDWSRFFARRGKLILYSTANDYLANPRNTMQLYEAVAQKHGQKKVDASVRYYVMPFATHDSVGNNAQGAVSPTKVDLLAALDGWVQTGKPPPDALTQVLNDAAAPHAVIRSKPLCRYPAYPAYMGGDADQATAYQCKQP